MSCRSFFSGSMLKHQKLGPQDGWLTTEEFFKGRTWWNSSHAIHGEVGISPQQNVFFFRRSSPRRTMSSREISVSPDSKARVQGVQRSKPCRLMTRKKRSCEGRQCQRSSVETVNQSCLFCLSFSSFSSFSFSWEENPKLSQDKPSCTNCGRLKRVAPCPTVVVGSSDIMVRYSNRGMMAMCGYRGYHDKTELQL